MFVLWCAGGRCNMADSDLVQRIGDSQAQVGYSVVG
jgi:hypothetical protein